MSVADVETVLKALYGCNHLIPGYMTDEGRRVFAAFDRLEQTVARLAEAEKALREIAEYEDSHGAGPPEDVMQEIAREALAALEPEVEVDLLPSPQGHGDASCPGYYPDPPDPALPGSADTTETA